MSHTHWIFNHTECPFNYLYNRHHLEKLKEREGACWRNRQDKVSSGDQCGLWKTSNRPCDIHPTGDLIPPQRCRIHETCTCTICQFSTSLQSLLGILTRTRNSVVNINNHLSQYRYRCQHFPLLQYTTNAKLQSRFHIHWRWVDEHRCQFMTGKRNKFYLHNKISTCFII